MKKYIYYSLLLTASIGFTACENGEDKKKVDKEVTTEEELSDAEYEKEMEKLDEDVEALETIEKTR